MKVLSVVFLLFIAAACGSSDTAETTETAADTGKKLEAQQIPTLDALPEPVKLTEKTVKNFIAAAKELSKMGDEITLSDSDARDFWKGLSLSKEANEVLDDHGFKPVEFQRVGFSIGLAMAAEEMAQNSEEIEEAKKNLEAMKGKLPEAQYNAMKKQMLGAMEMFEDVPEENVELVKKYKDEFDAL